MTALSTPARFDRAFFARLADWLAVGVALVLPWSTSATAILIALWLVAVLATVEPAAFKRELVTPAGGLPVLIFCLGAVGMLWANVDWSARLGGLDGFLRLLMIPLLLAQFRRSEYGGLVVYGFFISSTILLALSFILVLTPSQVWRGRFFHGAALAGVPVHDDIFQGSVFLICAFGALGYTILNGRRIHWRARLALIGIGAGFLANFGFAAFSRIAVGVAPVFAALLGWRLSGWKGLAAISLVGAILGAAVWFSSPSVRTRTDETMDEINQYRAANAATSIGMHAAFVKESLTIIATAPIIGHGTGSIAAQFQKVTAGQSGAAAVDTVNPHNQTFAVAIQLGLVGTLALWAMWLVHFLLFRGQGIAAWLGTLVVVENIVSSTVHSHLFDFNNGWLYVLGVGVLGGMVLRQRASASAN
jgi:O-antigen ligase